ncbi:MAG: hypothetical protein KDB22_22205, partial [Planctomycetales bacterium]|nr:hypothetical protein [Planctomycetales bacterium]
MKSSRVKAPLLVVCGLSFLAGCVPTPVAMTPRTAEDLHSAETDFVSDAESELRQRMINVLQLGLEQRQLSSTENAAWQIMHGVACYGMQLSISTPDRGDVGAV